MAFCGGKPFMMINLRSLVIHSNYSNPISSSDTHDYKLCVTMRVVIKSINYPLIRHYRCFLLFEPASCSCRRCWRCCRCCCCVCCCWGFCLFCEFVVAACCTCCFLFVAPLMLLLLDRCCCTCLLASLAAWDLVDTLALLTQVLGALLRLKRLCNLRAQIWPRRGPNQNTMKCW